MTPLNGPALEKGMDVFFKKFGGGRWSDEDYALYRGAAEAAILAYRDALPQSGVAARLLEAADGLENGPYTSIKTTRELLREAAALLSGVELPGWRTIETAPKDTALLLYSGHTYEIGHYNTALNAWVDGWQHRRLAEPTHWQPLPSPPTGDAP